MTGLEAVLLALEVVVAALAWAWTRRERAHRPLAVYLSWMAAESPLRQLGRSLRHGPSADYTGVALASFELDKLVVLSWTFGFVALSVHYFLRRPAWPILLFGIGVWVVSLPHPAMTGESLFTLYSAVFVGGVVSSWVSIGWAILVRPAAVEPQLAHWILLAYASFDFVCALAPFIELEFIAQWEQLRLASSLITIGVAIAHVYWHVQAPRAAVRSSSSR